MKTTPKCISVALIDSCEFTKIGLSQLILLAKKDNINLNISSFADVNALNESETPYDVIIYDPLNSPQIIININQDVLSIKEHHPQSRIFLFSLATDFVKQPQVDGMFSKKIALEDLNSLWGIIINKITKFESHFNVNLTAVAARTFSLSNSEISVLRGYSANLKTKQIANHMGCDIKKIYYYKRTAIDKIENLRSSPFYSSARRFLN
ncbi:DNA-binding response regulator [Dryocola sp. BD613]|uniref:DNA-binding response regulator n=1 Tax=Dryocola sp. BD613 TaxID=3133272 RepID=UPI003F502CFE